MSGNDEHSGPAGEKPSVPPGGEPERGRAISASPPPTDDLDSEWDSSPAEAVAEKPAEKPSVRPAAVVVRTNPPPPMTVKAGTDAGNTLLGVAPPAVASQLKGTAAVSPIPPAPAVPAEAAAIAPAPPTDEAPPENPKSDPAPETSNVERAAAESPKVEPTVATAVEKAEAQPQPKIVLAKAPASAARAARATELSSSPDSVAASSSDRRARERAEEPVVSEPQRSSRGLWIAAAAAVVIFGLWYALRPSAGGDSAAKTETSPPAALAQVSNAEPAPAAPGQHATEPAAPAAEPATTAAADPATNPAPPAATEPPPAADGKKVVIVKVRPSDARFYYKGKKMGGSPMRVELAPGEKRAFEVGHPLFVTRKVVVDGSQPEVIVGLHPKTGSALAQPKAPVAGEPEGRP